MNCVKVRSEGKCSSITGGWGKDSFVRLRIASFGYCEFDG